MKKICITGGIACGKSEVGKMIESYGFLVLDTDIVAHRILESDLMLARVLVSGFGKTIIDPKTGSINRKELGKIVFNHRKSLDFLNGLIHPKVLCFTRQWINTMEWFYPEQPLSFCLVPLVFEINDQDNWDIIICVSSSKSIQKNRMKARGLDDREIDKRMASQMDLEEKEKRSRLIIENNGTIEDLGKEVLKTIGALKQWDHNCSSTYNSQRFWT
jgi:dephospho-CoA kinase